MPTIAHCFTQRSLRRIQSPSLKQKVERLRNAYSDGAYQEGTSDLGTLCQEQTASITAHLFRILQRGLSQPSTACALPPLDPVAAFRSFDVEEEVDDLEQLPFSSPTHDLDPVDTGFNALSTGIDDENVLIKLSDTDISDISHKEEMFQFQSDDDNAVEEGLWTSTWCTELDEELSFDSPAAHPNPNTTESQDSHDSLDLIQMEKLRPETSHHVLGKEHSNKIDMFENSRSEGATGIWEYREVSPYSDFAEFEMSESLNDSAMTDIVGIPSHNYDENAWYMTDEEDGLWEVTDEPTSKCLLVQDPVGEHMVT